MKKLKVEKGEQVLRNGKDVRWDVDIDAGGDGVGLGLFLWRKILLNSQLPFNPTRPIYLLKVNF